MRSMLLALAVVAAAGSSRAQRPEFDAASIKPNNSSDGRSSTSIDGSGLFIVNASLRKCLDLAYDVSEDRENAIDAPEWTGSDRYDIVAKFPPGAPLPQVRQMLQNLLADRFQLKLHRENRQTSVYLLVVAKSGSRLREAAPGSLPTIGMNANRLTARSVPIRALVDRLSGSAFQLGRPVVDRTGLMGVYDFTLDWIPQTATDATQPADSLPPSLFTALQEQLGLKLESGKAPVEVIVVDSLERKPAAN